MLEDCSHTPPASRQQSTNTEPLFEKLFKTRNLGEPGHDHQNQLVGAQITAWVHMGVTRPPEVTGAAHMQGGGHTGWPSLGPQNWEHSLDRHRALGGQRGPAAADQCPGREVLFWFPTLPT